MSISRNFTWIDDQEHSDQDERRAAALARAWSALQSQIEDEHFARQDAYERGDDGPEPDECPRCVGRGYLGVDNPESYRADCVALAVNYTECNYCFGQAHLGTLLQGITCPACDGEGWDKVGERERQATRQARVDDRNLEIEIIEEKLAHLGARMMRPYEHWNEDERLMEYLERDR